MSFIIYKSTADLLKLQNESSDSDREKYAVIESQFQINIQPAGLEYTATQPDGAIGKLFRGFTQQAGIKQGMIVALSGTVTVSGMRMEVMGIEDFRGPLGQHFELLLRSQQN